MGNQHASQLRLKPHQLKQRLVGSGIGSNRLKLIGSATNSHAADQGTAFVCHANGVMIGKAQFKCTFCSVVKPSAGALQVHYDKRHTGHNVTPIRRCGVHGNTCPPQSSPHADPIQKTDETCDRQEPMDSMAATDQTDLTDRPVSDRSSNLYLGGGTVLELLNRYTETNEQANQRSENRWKSEQTIGSSNYPERTATMQSTYNLNDASLDESVSVKSVAGRLTLFVQDYDLVVRCASSNYNRLDYTLGDTIDRPADGEGEVGPAGDASNRIVELARLREQLSKLNRHSRLNLMLIGEDGNALVDQNGPLTHIDASATIESIRERATAQHRKSKNSLGSSIEEDDSEEDVDADTTMMNDARCETKKDGIKLNSDIAGQDDDDHDSEKCGQSDILNESSTLCVSPSSLDANLIQASDARCAVCLAHNYVVCIQRRLGKLFTLEIIRQNF